MGPTCQLQVAKESTSQKMMFFTFEDVKNQRRQGCLKSKKQLLTPPPPFATNFLFLVTLNSLNGPLIRLWGTHCKIAG